MPLRTIILIFLCYLPGHTQAKDLKRIVELPNRLKVMQIEGHKKWDTGVTTEMIEGTSEYNIKLVTIIKELIAAYYKKGFIPTASVDEFVKSLTSANRFRQQARNPTGEWQGTISLLDIPSSLTVDLKTTIVEMAKSITEDDSSFDFPAWEKSWNKASSVGN